MSGKSLDDLDDFFAAEAVVVGEFDELPCPVEHRPPLGVPATVISSTGELS
jgi:hypothetical protein